MKALIQRVSSAKVEVGTTILGQIDCGLLVFIGVEENDHIEDIDYLVKKISGLRIFSDDDNKMNLSIKQINGSLLIVSQFTLIADTRKGNRPSFNNAANPTKGFEYYTNLINKFEHAGIPVESGKFGAAMNVTLVNDGPVTIWLDTRDRNRPRN